MKKLLPLFLILTSLSMTSDVLAKTITKEMKMVLKDLVEGMSKPVNNKSEVTFQVHAGVYYLYSKNKDYKTIKISLEKSKNEKKEIAVEVDPLSMEIQKVK